MLTLLTPGFDGLCKLGRPACLDSPQQSFRGWTQIRDRVTGVVYFRNNTTGESQVCQHVRERVAVAAPALSQLRTFVQALPCA